MAFDHLLEGRGKGLGSRYRHLERVPGAAKACAVNLLKAIYPKVVHFDYSYLLMWHAIILFGISTDTELSIIHVHIFLPFLRGRA